MSTLARWTIRPRLMAIPGVANVAIWGQRDRQLQVLVDPNRLQAHGVTVDDVVRATGEAVSLQAGGFLDTPNQRLAITHAASVRERARSRSASSSHRETARRCELATWPPSSRDFRSRSATPSSTTVRACS